MQLVSQVDGVETENVCDEKLLVTPDGPVRRFVLEECKAVPLDGR